MYVDRILKHKLVSLLCLARFGFVFSKMRSDAVRLHLTVVLVVSENSSLYQLYQNIVSTINLLKPKTYIMYHQLYLAEILCSAHNALMCLCGSQNKQRFLIFTALNYRFL